MANQITSPIQPSDTPAPAPAPAPANTVQDTLVAQLRAMRDLIPDYTQLSTKEKRSLIPVAKATDPDFVQASINTVGASANVQQAIGATPEELRQDTMDAQGWTAVEDAARAFLNGVITANLVRRFRIGKRALATYSIATRLVQQPGHTDLLPHVATMKRLNRFGKKRASAAPKAVPPAPAPATEHEPPAQPVTATAPPEPPKTS